MCDSVYTIFVHGNSDCQSKRSKIRETVDLVFRKIAARVKCDTVIKHEASEIVEFKHAKILSDTQRSENLKIL